jgi:hypothetical protein
VISLRLLAAGGVGLRHGAVALRQRGSLELFGWRRAAHRGAVAAPGPQFGLGAEAGAHRVEDDIARQFQQVGLALHDDGFEAPLEPMSDAAMSPVMRTRR